MKQPFQKLVRDRIPEIISAEGKSPVVRTLSGEEFKKELLNKLVEEAKEAAEAGGAKKDLMKELGDVREVLDAIIHEFGIDEGEAEKMQKERREARGGFDKKVFLEYIEDN